MLNSILGIGPRARLYRTYLKTLRKFVLSVRLVSLYVLITTYILCLIENIQTIYNKKTIYNKL